MRNAPPAAMLLVTLALASCAKLEEVAPSLADASEWVCSIAPSQSELVASIGGSAGGAAATTAALAQALGMSVVSHSSGALILTGSGGYIAGTLGTAAAGPVVVGVGIAVASTAATIELLCAPRNHPEMVAKVEAAATEVWARSKAAATTASDKAVKVVSKTSVALLKSGEEAFAYAYRKGTATLEAIRE